MPLVTKKVTTSYRRPRQNYQAYQHHSNSIRRSMQLQPNQSHSSQKGTPTESRPWKLYTDRRITSNAHNPPNQSRPRRKNPHRQLRQQDQQSSRLQQRNSPRTTDERNDSPSKPHKPTPFLSLRQQHHPTTRRYKRQQAHLKRNITHT